MINLNKALLFIVIANISGSAFSGSFFPFCKNSFHQHTFEDNTTCYHMSSFPYIFPIIKKFTLYGIKNMTHTDGVTSCLYEDPKPKSVLIKRNIALWTIGIGATGFAAWYNRDSIAAGLEKLAAFIKKE